jgi:hypothetical protein
MKTCTKCGFPRPLEEFVKNNRLKSGYGSRCLLCCRSYGKSQYHSNPIARADKLRKTRLRRSTPDGKIKRREYRSKTYAGSGGDLERVKNRDHIRLRREQVNTLKAKPCGDCHEIFPSCCMDFDHVRGRKIKGIGEMLSHTLSGIRSEIDKCDLVCACCHRVRTWGTLNVASRPDVQRALDKVALLKAAPCMDCGACFPPTAMDFDHVRGVKVATISYLISKKRPWSMVLQEIDKCDLVCANCHRIRTNSRVVRVAA